MTWLYIIDYIILAIFTRVILGRYEKGYIMAINIASILWPVAWCILFILWIERQLKRLF